MRKSSGPRARFDTKSVIHRRKREKDNKLDPLKIKNFFWAKVPLQHIKREAADWDKVFANHIYGKDLYIVEYIKNLKIK